ncbi:LysM peptidoglycan-binding domain-containing protein [Clostridium formicaceticum]|uniref:Spore germination protein YaaH n=1 Tax=Clostridium formicaceticum TaxID=1497 RepID=A0AAC9RMS5_9CLOT|nr:LysM peptidoglycan-binding domain-containing protein [Clostridium formicaceticum]AOY77869.1 hypothetical protein BJL90_19590 [Clostridium formicaceticum]ARE88487.1 Spore germination protein YaaH [Clostridium formicaceticum]
MIYIVRPGDSLYLIARRFGVTVQTLLDSNVICNPNLIYPGQVLVIPQASLEIPKAGGTPYYVILPGDTLFCLARQFNTSTQILAQANRIPDPNLIFAGSELLIAYDIPDPRELQILWEQTALNCDILTSLQIYGIYYLGTFQWEAIGQKAIPYLGILAVNPCSIVRYYAIISLGRIALNGESRRILTNALQDPDPIVVQLTRLALSRLDYVRTNRRIHVTISDTQLYSQPFLDTPYITLPPGTAIIVERWYIPSPIGEDFPPAGLAVWDYVRVIATGQTGFLLRVGYNQTLLI